MSPVALGSVATAMIDKYSGYDLARDPEGNPYCCRLFPNLSGNEQSSSYDAGKSYCYWSHKFVPKFSVDLGIWDNIKYHFNYSAGFSFLGNNGATTSLYYLSGNNNANHTGECCLKRAIRALWQVENTLTWDKTIGKHTIGVVLVSQRSIKVIILVVIAGICKQQASIDYATGSLVL